MSTSIKESKNLNFRVGEIKRWMTIGPFATETVDKEFISVEEIDPNKVYVHNGRELKWESWHAGDGCLGIYNFNTVLRHNTLNTYYLANFFYLTKETSANFFFKTNSHCDWLINGRKEYSFGKDSGPNGIFLSTLRRGWNLILVKCVLETRDGVEHDFRAGITDAGGREIKSLLIKNGFVLPDDTETHMFGKNPGDLNQSIEIGDLSLDYNRSNPDIVAYLPREGGEYNDGDNEHFLVTKSPNGDNLLAFWTQASAEAFGDNHLMMFRSNNGGLNWSEPQFITGTKLGGNETQASWGFPICSACGRLYCFYTKSAAGTPSGLSGIMGTMQSDDEGRTWRHGHDILVPTTRSAPEDKDSPVVGHFIAWQLPIKDAKGRQIVGYTVWKEGRGRCFLMRFDNINEGPDIEDLVMTWLPENNESIELPESLIERECSEPSVVLLPDGRLFMTMRTMTGCIWFSVSDDDGCTWRKPEELKYNDLGKKIKHPLSCCPIYALENGKYILLHNNNNYFAEKHYNGEDLPAGMNMFTHRRPAFVSVGKYMPDANQPISFEEPRIILDNDGVIIGPKATNEIGTYPSLTEYNGKRILWYPDRKYYLLGKILTDELLGL